MTNVGWEMALFTLVGAITPGPVNVLALRHGVTARAAVSVAFVAGASLCYAGVVALMGLGAAQWLQQPAWVSTARWAGGAYMLWLAWRIAFAPVQSLDGRPLHAEIVAPGEGFVQGSLTQGLNPKAWLVSLSGVSLFVLPQVDPDAVLGRFVLTSLLMCALGVGCWAGAGRWLARVLAAPARQRGFNRLLAGVLAVSVVAMF